MADYELTSRWRLSTSRDQLWALLGERLASDDPVPWWRAVSSVRNDADGMVLEADSRVGYRLRFRLHELEQQPPSRVAFLADGDLVGDGELRFSEDGPDRSVVDIRWSVSPTVRWMRRSAWLLRPLFVLTHAVVMWQGRRDLERWVRTSAL